MDVGKALFWCIIFVLFLILYLRSRQLRIEFENEMKHKIGDEGIIMDTNRGELFMNYKTIVEPIVPAISGISKLSEIAMIISAFAALISVFL